MGASDYVDYTYDANGNILTISEYGTLKVTYYYDELNRLVREDNVWENKTICYTYDIGGNMLSWKEYAYTTGAIAADAVPTLTYSYTYGNTAWKDQLTAFNGMPITYDAMGNPLQYKWWTFGWKKGRQLVSIDDGFEPILFTYDNEGRRIRKSYWGEVTDYYWNGNQLAAMNSTYGMAKFIYDEAGKPMIMIANGTPYFYQTNLQGDVVGLLDANGTQVVSYSYNSWGRMLSMSDTSNAVLGLLNPFRYRGYIQDDDTGLYYVGTRYYDPETGRFINPDTTDILTVSPMDLTDKNLYAYCDDNPVMRMDVNGQLWTAIALSVGINFACLAIESLITGEKPTTEDIVWCLIGGAVTGALGFWCETSRVVTALSMGAYAGFENAVRTGTDNNYLKAFGFAAISSSIGPDEEFRIKAPTSYEITATVCEQGTNVLLESYSDIVNNNYKSQIVSGNGGTLNIVTGGINSWGVRTNSDRNSAKSKSIGGTAGGILKSIVSNMLYLFR